MTTNEQKHTPTPGTVDEAELGVVVCDYGSYRVPKEVVHEMRLLRDAVDAAYHRGAEVSRMQLADMTVRHDHLLKIVSGQEALLPPAPIVLQGASAQAALENVTINDLTAERDRLREANAEMLAQLSCVNFFIENSIIEGRMFGDEAMSNVTANRALIAKHSADKQTQEG